MAFDIDNFNNTTSGAADAPRIWAYRTTADTLAQVAASAYFNTVINALSVGDKIYVVATDGNGDFVVDSVTTNVALTGGGGSLVSEVAVTSAELLALAAAPKTLVAAPGAGLLARFNKIELYLDFNTTAYTITNAGDDISVRYTDGAGAIVSQTLQAQGFLDATEDAYLQGQAVDEVGGDLADHANQALVLDNIGAAEWTLGDSPVTVRVHYSIETVPF